MSISIDQEKMRNRGVRTSDRERKKLELQIGILAYILRYHFIIYATAEDFSTLSHPPVPTLHPPTSEYQTHPYKVQGIHTKQRR